MNPPKESCRWIISPPGKLTPCVECRAPSTHYCSESGSQYCWQHAEDYAEVFGDDSLKEFKIQEPNL